MAWEVDESTGLFDEYIGTITNSRFATDATYMNGNVYLWLFEQGNVTDADGQPLIGKDGNRMEITDKFSLGAGWEATNGGLLLEHSSGNAKKKINASSWYGKVIQKVPEMGPDLMKVLESRSPLSEFNADVWEGLRFRWERVTLPENPNFKNDDGTPRKQSHILPVEFLGVGEGEKAKAPVAAPAASTDDLRAKLVTLAQSCNSHDEFMDKALDVDGVVESGPLVKEIGKVSFYEEANA